MVVIGNNAEFFERGSSHAVVESGTLFKPKVRSVNEDNVEIFGYAQPDEEASEFQRETVVQLDEKAREAAVAKNEQIVKDEKIETSPEFASNDAEVAAVPEGFNPAQVSEGEHHHHDHHVGSHHDHDHESEDHVHHDGKVGADHVHHPEHEKFHGSGEGHEHHAGSHHDHDHESEDHVHHDGKVGADHVHHPEHEKFHGTENAEVTGEEAIPESGVVHGHHAGSHHDGSHHDHDHELASNDAEIAAVPEGFKPSELGEGEHHHHDHHAGSHHDHDHESEDHVHHDGKVGADHVHHPEHEQFHGSGDSEQHHHEHEVVKPRSRDIVTPANQEIIYSDHPDHPIPHHLHQDAHSLDPHIDSPAFQFSQHMHSQEHEQHRQENAPRPLVPNARNMERQYVFKQRPIVFFEEQPAVVNDVVADAVDAVEDVAEPFVEAEMTEPAEPAEAEAEIEAAESIDHDEGITIETGAIEDKAPEVFVPSSPSEEIIVNTGTGPDDSAVPDTEPEVEAEVPEITVETGKLVEESSPASGEVDVEIPVVTEAGELGTPEDEGFVVFPPKTEGQSEAEQTVVEAEPAASVEENQEDISNEIVVDSGKLVTEAAAAKSDKSSSYEEVEADRNGSVEDDSDEKKKKDDSDEDDDRRKRHIPGLFPPFGPLGYGLGYGGLGYGGLGYGYGYGYGYPYGGYGGYYGACKLKNFAVQKTKITFFF